MADIYGQLVKAQFENLASDPSTVSTGLAYLNTGSSLMKFYDGAVWRTTVTLDNTQTLTGKTLSSGIMDVLTDFKEVSAPATPSAGSLRVYAKSDHKLYIKDSTGTETDLSSAGTTATPTALGVTTSYFPTIASGIKTVSGANYTVTTTDGYASVYVDTTGTNRTITLPLASANIGRILRVRRTDVTNASKVIITAAGSDVIYSGTSLTATSVNCEKFNSLVVLEAIASGIWAVDEGVTFDIGTTTLDGGFTGGSAHVYRCGSIIHVTIEAPTWNSGSFTYTSTTAIIPANFRPAGSGTTATIICGAPSDGSHGYNMTFAVLANGTLKLFQATNSSTGPDDYTNLAGCYNLRF